ncbi:hypothetical protein ACWD01_01430 [Streptomyces sp. NPDC002835]
MPIAHNGRFDHGFLTHEFARAKALPPVSRRLCTPALNRRVDPPTGDPPPTVRRRAPDSAVRLLTDGPTEQTVTADLAAPARGYGGDVAD